MDRRPRLRYPFHIRRCIYLGQFRFECGLAQCGADLCHNATKRAHGTGDRLSATTRALSLDNGKVKIIEIGPQWQPLCVHVEDVCVIAI